VTGNADFTGLSFQPDAILLASVGHTTAPPATTVHANLTVGAATSSSAQAFMAAWDRDGITTAACGYAANALQCVSILESSISLAWRGAFVSFLSNGFRINWVEVLTGGPYIFGLALKGGSYRVGDLTTSTTLNATMTESGFGFQPTGLFFFSACDVVTADNVVGTGARVALGAATSTTKRGTHTFGSLHSAATSNIAVGVEHDEAYQSANVTTGATDGLLDINSIDSGGFTGIMDDGDSIASFVGYLAVGNATTAFVGDEDGLWYSPVAA
jgi:hypothetical protein